MSGEKKMVSSEAFLKKIKSNFSKKNPDIIFDKNKKIEFIKTGCFPFDLFVGGFPRARISEIFGPEHSGKSSLLVSTAVNIQKAGGLSIFLDLEGTFNAEFAKSSFGLNLDDQSFLLFQPLNAEEADSIISEIEPNLERIDAIFIDSIAALRSKAELEKSLEDSQKLGHHSNSVGRLVDKLIRISLKKNCAVVLINQLRANINTNPYAPKAGVGNMNFSDKKTTGGEAVKFYMSLRVLLSNSKNVDKETKVVLGNDTKFSIVKNKVGSPFIDFISTFNLAVNGQKPGWSYEQDLLSLGTRFNFIEQNGGKFKYHGTAPEFCLEVFGKSKGETTLLSNANIRLDLENRIISQVKNSLASKESLSLGDDFQPFDDYKNDDVLEI